jgi:hypothetical protein
VEAAATADENRWHEALDIAVDQRLRLIAVDALEGLAISAAGVESWAESLLLFGAAQRLRNETGYHWRFAGEQRSISASRSRAIDALSATAEAAEEERHAPDWRAAAAYARRARDERKRHRPGRAQ